MRGVWLIFWRETRAYFASPLAYLIAFAFLVITGIIFNNDLTLSVDVKPANPAIVPIFLVFGMIFFSPILTMRLLAEESREGTLELLLTAPVRDNDIVFGKFLSAWFYYSVLLAITFIYQVILISITNPDLGHAISAYLGIWLYGGATIAVGLLFSSLTENQIVAAFLSGTALLFFWLGDLAGQIISNIEIARIVRTLSLGGHFSTSFGQGLIRAEDVVYYAGLMAVMLFITIRVVESHRWR